MSEHMFGVTRMTIYKPIAKRLDAICKEEGGYGFVGPVRIPGNESRGWFTAPNHGHPFDSERASRVMRRVSEEFPALYALAWPKG